MALVFMIPKFDTTVPAVGVSCSAVMDSFFIIATSDMIAH